MSVSLFNRLLVAPIPYLPKSLVWPLSRRYIAGTDLDSAYATVRELNAAGCSATVDVLGEDSDSQNEVENARDIYLAAINGIDRGHLNCNISVKLSDLGLRFDKNLCLAATRALVAAADVHGNFVRIDMEDSSVTSATLDIYRRLRQEYPNVGTVIQSCMRRSGKDVHELLDEGPTYIRLCKGIYLEPEKLAFTDADQIRQSYCQLLEQLFAGGVKKLGIATHDPILVEYARDYVEANQIDSSRYEFQMLLGVAESLRDELVSAGHPLRVYVPFGERWVCLLRT